MLTTMGRTNVNESTAGYHELKDRLHQRVIEVIDLNALAALPPDAVQNQLTRLVEQLLQQESVPLNQRERAQLVQDTIHEVLGLGPLEPLLADTAIAIIRRRAWRCPAPRRYRRIPHGPTQEN